ncbi:MAG: sulfur carrier protein ThiS [Bacteroidaceae bacterium]|nr:sulfur carrier protein ThiS [Bacteroidaceae bacterium]
MTLTINNTPYETNAATLAQLAEQHALPASGVAIAVDNKMIPRSEWAAFTLQEKQKITILRAFSGG